MNENQWTEKRQFQRAKIIFAVMYKVNSPLTVRMMIGDKKEAALALDISAGGMGLLINSNIPISTKVTVKFAMVNLAAHRIKDQYRSMELEGEVRYSFYLEEKYAYRVGIRFNHISNDERNFIADFVKVISSKQNTNK